MTLNKILSNQNTITNIVGQCFIQGEHLQAEIASLKCSIDFLKSVLDKDGPSDLHCLAEFPINDDVSLEEFNNKLKDSAYKNSMVS